MEKERNFYDDFYDLIDKIHQFERCDLHDRDLLFDLAIELYEAQALFVHNWSPAKEEE